MVQKVARVSKELRMRRTVCWGTAVFVAATLGGGAVPPISDLGLAGIGAAEAKSFYTRKRVKGRWVTGHFAKKHFAQKQTVAKASRSEKRAKASAHAVPVSSSFAALATSSPEPVTATTQPTPMLQATRTMFPAAPVGRLAQGTPASSAAPFVPSSEDERLSKLREALQARASALTTGSVAAAQVPRPAPEPQSVSLDFKSGTKTTHFTDGTAVTEPFDVGAMKSLAAVPPQPKAGLQ
jgi:hypothetical protein